MEMNDAIAPAEVVTQDPAATPENVATDTAVTETPEVEKQAQAEKTLTQAEVDAIVQKEKAKAEAKAERRAMKAYRETLERFIPKQEPQQTDPGRPERARFNSDEEWVEAVTDWKIGLRDKAYQAQAQQQQFTHLQSKVEKIYSEAEKIDGFDRNAFDEISITPAISAAVIESEFAPQLMAYMLENRDEVARIVRLSPVRQAAEMGRLEAKVSAPKTPKASNAPAPIVPVGGNKGGTKDPTEMSDAEFAKWRREQIKQRGS